MKDGELDDNSAITGEHCPTSSFVRKTVVKSARWDSHDLVLRSMKTPQFPHVCRRRSPSSRASSSASALAIQRLRLQTIRNNEWQRCVPAGTSHFWEHSLSRAANGIHINSSGSSLYGPRSPPSDNPTYDGPPPIRRPARSRTAADGEERCQALCGERLSPCSFLGLHATNDGYAPLTDLQERTSSNAGPFHVAPHAVPPPRALPSAANRYASSRHGGGGDEDVGHTLR